MRYAVAPVLAAALLLASAPGGVAAGPVTGSSTADEAAVTTAPAATAPAAPSAPADVRPRLAPLLTPLGDVAEGEPPSPPALSERLTEEMTSRWLGPSNRRAILVRDALTGEVLAETNARRLMTPASTTKLIAAAAIVTGLDGEHRFRTRVVAGPEPDQVVIVAGGDMLLADGMGDGGAVAGHAGIADLARQTAQTLATGDRGDGAATTAQGGEAAAGTQGTDAAAGTGGDHAAAATGAAAGPVRVALDLSHVAGPHAMPSWSDHWVAEGWTGRVVQLGRSVDRALPYNPSPRAPEQEVARVFREALAAEGVEVAGAGDEDARAEEVVVTDDAPELAVVESAAVRDVLALALATSDNAMMEQLARQAAVADGESADQESVTAWITRTMTEDYGIDMTGMQVADASGLSDGTRLSMSAVADVLVAGADGSHPGLQEVLAAGGLPIAGYTGTLGNGMRFHLDQHAPAVGIARAKTGTLPGVTALAGTVVTQDGRLLVFALAADAIEEGSGALEAVAVIDEIVAELAGCGC